MTLNRSRHAQDPSRLLDLCRQSILFGAVGDVAACLAAIAEDPDVRVVQARPPHTHAAAAAAAAARV